MLAALTCRGVIEVEAAQPGARSLQDRLLNWLTQLALWNEADSSERQVLQAPPGQLKHRDAVQLTWYSEGLVILAWTLNCFDFPQHDLQVDAPAVAESVGFLSEDALTVLQTMSLRSPNELIACREVLYAIHARITDFLRHRTPKDFRQWIEPSWCEILNIDPDTIMVDGDLAIGTWPIYDVELSCVEQCSHIALERHRAILWLVEGDQTYAETQVAT